MKYSFENIALIFARNHPSGICYSINTGLESVHYALFIFTGTYLMMRLILKKHLYYHLNRNYNNRGQLQYDYIENGMIFEEYLEFSIENGYIEFGFNVVHGVIYYIQAMCDTRHFAYFNANWEQLYIEDHQPFKPCEVLPKKPDNWEVKMLLYILLFKKHITGVLLNDCFCEEMKDIARKLGSLIPGRVRVDLFTNNTVVYFSELTLTPDACEDNSRPVINQKVELWMLENPELVDKVTPDMVKCLINEPGIALDNL